MKAGTQCVKSNLGLVCITTTDAVRYKTVTRKRLLSFDEPTQREMLRALYRKTSTAFRMRLNFVRRTALIFTG
jgi:UV DNA damage endonuclease